MSIKVYPYTKVYVVAPANTATGGPELLHQLVYHFRQDLHVDAYMYYIPHNHPTPIHSEYKQYNNPFVRKIEDSRKNILIVPEVKHTIKILRDYNRIRKVIWWLSIDNFYLSMILNSKKNLFIPRAINKISNVIFKRKIFDITELAYKYVHSMDLLIIPEIKQADFHLAQSHYAMEHLKEKGVSEESIFYLSDYLNKSFLETKTDISQKEDIVVFNPKKKFSFTNKIIKYAPDLKFIPLIKMTREEVVKTLQRAKVYIDFGNHPGKDRIPREAAILGTCVITGKRGSVRYFEDVPIPEKYKFEDKEENISTIIEKIKDCFVTFEERYEDFDYYKKIIKNEPKNFVEDMKKIFNRGER